VSRPEQQADIAAEWLKAVMVAGVADVFPEGKALADNLVDVRIGMS
jgi:hypothetical protein